MTKSGSLKQTWSRAASFVIARTSRDTTKDFRQATPVLHLLNRSTAIRLGHTIPPTPACSNWRMAHTIRPCGAALPPDKAHSSTRRHQLQGPGTCGGPGHQFQHPRSFYVHIIRPLLLLSKSC